MNRPHTSCKAGELKFGLPMAWQAKVCTVRSAMQCFCIAGKDTFE